MTCAIFCRNFNNPDTIHLVAFCSLNHHCRSIVGWVFEISIMIVWLFHLWFLIDANHGSLFGCHVGHFCWVLVLFMLFSSFAFMLLGLFALLLGQSFHLSCVPLYFWQGFFKRSPFDLPLFVFPLYDCWFDFLFSCCSNAAVSHFSCSLVSMSNTSSKILE